MTTTVEAASGRRTGWDIAALVALACYGFFAPFSTAGVSISGVALIGIVLLRPRWVAQATPWREPVFVVGLLLFAWIGLHTLASTGANATTVATLNRYHELVLAPILYVAMAEGRRRRAFFIAITAGLAFVAAAYWIVKLWPAAFPKLLQMSQSRRISAGFALALAAYLLLVHSREAARPWPLRALAAAFAATVLFANDGRTGHVVLVVLAAQAAWVLAPRRLRLLLALGLPVLIVGVGVLMSSAVQTRLQEASATSNLATRGADLSSTGVRLEMARLALDLTPHYALGGAGFANYARVQEQAARERYANDPERANYLDAYWVHSENPHNEYFMQLLGGGAVSLLLFLGWLAAMWRRGVATGAAGGALIGGAATAFAAGSLFNSLLLDFVEAHLFTAVLAGLMAATRRPLGATVPRRVLVLATRQIGDVLLTTPLIAAARRRWPQARIDVAGFAGTLGMLRGNPDVHGLIESPARRGWRETQALVRRLWRRYDLALVAQPSDRAHLMGWLAAPRRSGLLPARSGSNWWKRLLLDHAVVSEGDDSTQHAVQEKLALLAPWPIADEPPPAVVPPPAAALPADVLQQLQPGAVVVHVPSMWPYKQWAPQHYAQVVQALLGSGRQVLLTGSAGDRDQACIEPLRGLAPAPALLDLSGRLDFNQLVALLRSAALYIGPDTSVSHLAAATGVPTIAIFGPTNPQRWGPWPTAGEQPVVFHRRGFTQSSGNVTILQSDLPCVPCSRAGCEDHLQSRSDCLAAITPERVIEAALERLR
ncbi:glycosyltransferase family 9 protein [Ramlibacter tataouinensis]|uniref:glycosyltransferase family 9 protein n=1 Tax=Ramlibacter tataouinensis TaxID=94132 RepID=UPI0022F3F7B9|nr:glycosyltransferase family 9 protein [Ramlibacter tataouinensis]WBY01952.1 glycosyltransferase family 9 protein [Ramlibacter tataouinensis]